ncbi:MAG: hypothetical protein Q7O66_08365, partial [Dehalococcoidia bacterium]|nr:hypothetical protein [Dehalococcoidia bacterium]
MKILSHEKRLGGKDSAVIGGLDGYLSRWREHITSLAAGSCLVADSLRLVAPLHDYSLISTAQRGDLLSVVISGLSALAKGTPSSLATHSVSQASTPTKTDAEALAGKRVLAPAEASTSSASSSGGATSPGKTRGPASG